VREGIALLRDRLKWGIEADERRNMGVKATINPAANHDRPIPGIHGDDEADHPTLKVSVALGALRVAPPKSAWTA
jgi:hypothetical protein